MPLPDGIRAHMERIGQYCHAAWSKATSADQANWSYEKPAWGQSAPTALVIQYFFGGEILLLDISGAPDEKIATLRSHYLNRIGGSTCDFSASQFPSNEFYEGLYANEKASIQTKEELLSDPDTRRRFELLFIETVRLACDEFVKN